MNKPSKSPDRHSFQKDGYIRRQKEKGEPINEDYLDFFSKMIDDHNHKFDEPATRKNNMEYDLLTTDWILEKVRNSEVYAQNLYAAMCNNDFQKRDLWPILKEETWGCSWRYAGGIIADMRQEGDYIDWYCSGIRGDPLDADYEAADAQGFDIKNYVPESVVTDEVRDDLFKLGWLVVDDNNSQ
jgi:hypothetical protein